MPTGGRQRDLDLVEHPLKPLPLPAGRFLAKPDPLLVLPKERTASVQEAVDQVETGGSASLDQQPGFR